MKIKVSLKLKEILTEKQANRIPVDLLEEEIEIVLYETISLDDVLINRIKTNLKEV